MSNELADWGVQELSPRLQNKMEQALRSPTTAKAGTKTIEQEAGKHDPNAEPEGMIQDPDQFDKSYHSSSIILVKEIGDFLQKNYPGWAWVVQVNEFGHMIEVFNHHLHNVYGYRIRMEDIMFDPSRRVIRQAAGEILERFDMARHGLTGENLASLADAPRDAAGNCIPHVDDLPDKKAATQAEVARKIAKGDMEIYELNGQKFVRIKK